MFKVPRKSPSYVAEGVSRLKEQRENNRLGMGAGVARRGGGGGCYSGIWAF